MIFSPCLSGNQPIRTRYLGHVTGSQPIRDQCSLILVGSWLYVYLSLSCPASNLHRFSISPPTISFSLNSLSTSITLSPSIPVDYRYFVVICRHSGHLQKLEGCPFCNRYFCRIISTADSPLPLRNSPPSRLPQSSMSPLRLPSPKKVLPLHSSAFHSWLPLMSL